MESRRGGWSALHQRGFVKFARAEHGIEVDAPALLKAARFEPIFNVLARDVASSHRLQGRDGRGEVARFEAQARAFLHRLGWLRTASGTGANAFKRTKDAYALLSVANCADAHQFRKAERGGHRRGCLAAGCPQYCERQAFHADAGAPRQFADARVPHGDVPLVALLATQPAELHVKPLDGAGKEETVALDAGDLLVFRGDLSHAGAAYREDNLRLHVYIDSPLHPREKDSTYLDV